MNHRIFERNLRSWVFPGACLLECHHNFSSRTHTHTHTLKSVCVCVCVESEALSRDGSRFNPCGFKVVGEGAKGLDSLFSSYYHLMWQDSLLQKNGGESRASCEGSEAEEVTLGSTTQTHHHVNRVWVCAPCSHTTHAPAQEKKKLNM